MKLISLYLGAAWLAGAVWGWNHVDSAEYKATLAGNDHTLVAFVVPSDLKSKALEPEWDLAVQEAKQSLISVDCTAEAALCAENRVDEHPTVTAFAKDGRALSSYGGPRRSAAMVHFLNRWARPAVTAVTADSLASFKTIDETVFIAYVGAGSDGDEARRAFDEVAAKYRDEFSFGVVTDPGVSAEQDITPPAVVCYRVVDRDAKALPSFAYDPEALAKLVLEASRPVVGELTPSNHKRFLDREWPMVYLFADSEPERVKLRRELAQFAQSYYDSLTSVTVDPLYFPGLMAKLGLDEGVYPAGAVHQLSTDRIYPYPRGRAVDSRSLQGWGLGVVQGKIKPWTPPGATTTFANAGPTKRATRRVSINTQLADYIKVAGRRDEL